VLVSVLLLGILLAANCYRAATQSITHDEALTWQFYLAGPTENIFNHYDPNHHFLATLLFRLSTSLFGHSELSLRLPVLLAGALYFYSAFRLSRRQFGETLWLPVSVGLLCAHPLMLDFFVAARGYGLATAFLLWALSHACDLENPRSVIKAAAGLSLAVAANLTLLYPAAIMAGLVFYHLPRAPQQPVKKKQKRAPAGIAPRWRFAAVIAAFAALYLLTAPVHLIGREHLYAGADSLTTSLRGLAGLSFAYNDGPGSMLAAGGIRAMLLSVLAFLLPAVPAAALYFAAKLHDSCLLLVAGSAAGSGLLLILSHLLTGMPYPGDRTGLYFYPLTTLCFLILVHRLPKPFIALPALAGLIFLLQWNTSSFRVWRYDADNKIILSRLEQLAASSNLPISLGVSWLLEPAFNYYRYVNNYAWMPPLTRAGADGDYQFYVLTRNDYEVLERRKLRVLYRGEISGVVLAAPP